MMNVTEIIEATKAAFAERDVYFSLAQLPPDLEIPGEWQNFGIAFSETPSFPLAWRAFCDELPWLTALLDRCLLGTAILAGSPTELLYIFHDANGLYYYIGGEPLTDSDNPSAFGTRLSEFYKGVHNGFTFHPSHSMGPQKISDCTYISELIDEESTDFAAKWLTILSNGGGDYLAIDLNNLTDSNGIIWWHEQPMEPETGKGVFGVMDTWISIFLEDTLLRNDVLKY